MNINEDEDNKATQWIAARLEQAIQESGMRIKNISEKAKMSETALSASILTDFISNFNRDIRFSVEPF